MPNGEGGRKCALTAFFDYYPLPLNDAACSA